MTAVLDPAFTPEPDMSMSFRSALVAFAFVLLPSSAALSAVIRDGAVSGRVTDRAGQPIADASVSIAELAQSATTGKDGRFALGSVPRGRYMMSIRRLGYVSIAKLVDVADAAVVVDVTMDAGAVRMEPVNVTASRRPIAAVGSPLDASALTGEQVHPEGGISLAHSVAQLPGARVVSSGEQIGKPMIRGLFGPRVLVLGNGSRLEDYSWSDEDGPSIDARLAERIEVIRGPASVLYGSEALAGVVNVVPGALPFSADGSRIRREAAEAYAASNNLELGSALMVEGAQSRYGYRLQGTGRFSQNYQTPAGAQQNSSFWAFNGDGAFGIRGDHGTTTIRASHYGGEFHLLEASGPEAGDTEGGPVRQTLDDRLQFTNDYLTHGVRFETTAQWQRHGLTEVSDDCVPAPGQTTCTKVKDRPAFGLVLNTGTVDVMMHAASGAHLNSTIGVSGMYQSNSTTGPIFLIPSATTTNAAAFALEEATFGPLSVVGGARADARSLSADATSALQLNADDRSWSATSGNLGFVLRPVSALALVANVGTGWRAPTLFDLYANGPNLADARYEIGSPTLKTERAVNLDGGVRWETNRARAELSVYQNTVDNFIYTSRTPQTVNALRVYRHIQTDARLTGAELSGEVSVTEPLSLHASYDMVRGTDRTADQPLELMPAPRAILGADLHTTNLSWARRASIGAALEINQRQTRLNPNDFPTDGYTLLNVNLGMERMVRARPVRFDVSVRNALNTSYHDYLSRYKEFAVGQGVNVILKASTGAW